MNLLKIVREFLTKQITELNTAATASTVPATKAQFEAMKGSYTELLEKLPATEAAEAPTWFGLVVERLTAAIDAGVTKLKDLQTQFGTVMTELNEFKEKVTKGELVTKDAAKAAMDTARQEERNSLLPEITGTRKGALELAGLPVPSEKILALPCKEFNEALAGAKANIATLKQRGLELGGKGDSLVKNSIWLPVAELNGQLESMKDILPIKAGGDEPDPMLGGKDKNGGTKASVIPLGMA